MEAEAIKGRARRARDIFRNTRRRPILSRRLKSVEALQHFSFDAFKQQVLDFVANHAVDERPGVYRFSASSDQPTLYGSVYACLTAACLAIW